MNRKYIEGSLLWLRVALLNVRNRSRQVNSLSTYGIMSNVLFF
jgi:hypothetical protein